MTHAPALVEVFESHSTSLDNEAVLPPVGSTLPCQQLAKNKQGSSERVDATGDLAAVFCSDLTQIDFSIGNFSGGVVDGRREWIRDGSP